MGGCSSVTQNFPAQQHNNNDATYAAKKEDNAGAKHSAGTGMWLQPFWLGHTRMLRDLKMFQQFFRLSPRLKKTCEQNTAQIVEACCREGNQNHHGSTLANFVQSRNHTERAF